MNTGNNGGTNSDRKKAIAFITMTGNGKDEFQSELTRGMMKAAQEENVHVITLSFISTENPKIKDEQFPILLDFLDHFHLDGIMFLGWLKQFHGNALTSMLWMEKMLSIISGMAPWYGFSLRNEPEIFYIANQ